MQLASVCSPAMVRLLQVTQQQGPARQLWCHRLREAPTRHYSAHAVSPGSPGGVSVPANMPSTLCCMDRLYVGLDSGPRDTTYYMRQRSAAATWCSVRFVSLVRCSVNRVCHLPGRRRLSLLACARRHGLLNLSYSASAAEARLLQGHSNPGTLSENKQRCSCNASKPCRQVSQLLPGLLLLLQLLLLPLLLLLLAPAPAPAPCSLLLAPALAHAPAAAAVAEPTSGPHWACPG